MTGALRVGLRIDRYELTRQIAEGGFGVIFQARDVNLGRELAIKFLLPQHNSNPEIVSRFVGEARTLARVVHPGIVTVYESGEVQGTGTKADGTAFILMELLDGETLSQRLKRTGPLPPQTAMEICRQVANALNAAHQLGMIHRDLKPDNIMLVRDPAIAIGERAKVLDFGIAKNAANTTTTAATQIGMVFGTPAYMSPEQCRSSTDVTPASDVYALGCILFELLLGRPPFLGSGMGELFAAHLMSAPPVPSSLNPALPRHLDEVILAMLAKDPTGRPASMMVVERILEDSRLAGNKPARTRTLGGAILAGQLPFAAKAGFAVEMGPQTPIAMQASAPTTAPVTARGHVPTGPNTPISQAIVEAPKPTPMPLGAHEASTLLGATRPVMPTAAEAAEMMRKRSPSTAPPAAATMMVTTPEALKTMVAKPVDPHATMIAPQGIPLPPSEPRPMPQPQLVEQPRAHANPTTMSSAMGQATSRPVAKSNSKVWIIAAVVAAIGIAVVIVVIAGGGGSSTSAAADPPGSDTSGSGSSVVVTPPVVTPNHGSGSAIVTTNGSSGSAVVTTNGSGSAVVANGSGDGSSGSAVANNGSATPIPGEGSAKPHDGSGSAIIPTTNGSGSGVHDNGAHDGSASHAGSGVHDNGTHDGSASHAGSGSAIPHAGSGSAIPHAGSGSAIPHNGSGSGSAKKPKDPHAGSGSAKCQGRSCILDGEF